jgi:hypothetical protein
MGVHVNVVGTPATPQFLEILWRGSVTLLPAGTRSIVQVYHFKQLDLTPSVEIMSSLLAQIRLGLDTVLKNALSVDYTGLDIRGRFMDDPTTGDTPYITPPSNGTVSGDRLPIFNAATVQMRSGQRGRSYRGSKHFAPVAESSTTEDALNVAGLALWNPVNAAISNLTLTGTNGTVWAPIILSRVNSDLTANPSIFTYADFEDSVLNAKVGTMRRRKRSVTT